ncbi:MAG: D-alanyl-D-alanine carboxypeptidase [Armatimonadetes bacterium]|nr:D-alanyl-D-alanine carboxypeptidase [Armatimonadota bacterium]
MTALLLALALGIAPANAALPPKAPAKSGPPVIGSGGGVLIGPTLPTEHSHYAVLIDAVTGKVLWGRNENVRRPMASTTKMMTALLLLEQGHLNDVVVAPKGVDQVPPDSLHLSPGEKISLHDLLYAMLLRSANDTAVAGAHYLAGSVPAFVALMNQKAKEIGAANTHFVTPNGLYAPGHYSTAADLAKIAAYAVNTQPVFDQIVRTQKYKIRRSMHIYDVWVKNTSDTFLKFFPGADGIKTGYVHQAGHCFVGSATRQKWRLIAVALDSGTCREDVESLLNYGFANFAPTTVVPQQADVGTVSVPLAAGPAPVQAAGDIRVVLSRWQPRPGFEIRVMPLVPQPAAPVRRGTKLGTVVVLLDGKMQAMGDAVAARDVPVQVGAALLRTTGRAGLTLLKEMGVGLCALALLTVGGMIYGTAAKNARRRRRRLAARVRGVDS